MRIIVEDNALVASGMRAGWSCTDFTCDVAPDAGSARVHGRRPPRHAYRRLRA
ncbi:MAG: hypothetical protein U1E57_06350 [Paenacidovorax caeni]